MQHPDPHHRGHNSAPRMCVRCGKDCTAKPGARDSSDNFICGPCIALHKMKLRTPEPGVPSPASDHDYIPLEGLDPAQMNTLVRSESMAPPPVPTGRKLIEEVEESEGRGSTGYTCPACGYSLRGLKGVQCPECGAQVRGRSSTSHALEAIRDEARETVRWAYLRPAIAVGVGLAAIFIIRFSQGHLDLVHRDLVHYLVRVPAATGAYYLCCLAFIGFNAPFHLTVLRNAGTCAIISACYSFFLDPLRAMPVAVLCGVYIFLMWEEMQLELQEAWIVAATALGAMAIATYLTNLIAGW